MLRGYVERVADNVVSGWIYSEDVGLRDKTVLAFVGDQCVGSGRVDLFRQDLLDAGLGDGHLGFSFFVTVADPQDYARIVVRLDGSDAVLLQPSSEIVSRDAAAPARTPEEELREREEKLASLRWMRGQGWLSQSDFDFLRFFRQFGVYDRTLTVQAGGQGKTEAGLRGPAEAARELLMLYRMRDVDAEEVPVASLAALRDLLATRAAADSAVLALWSEQRGRLSLVEGSHAPQPAAGAPASDYALGPDRLLFVDARCQLGTDNVFPASGLTAFLAVPTQR